MICTTCGCRRSYCEKTLTGHSERCMDCGRVEYYDTITEEYGADYGRETLDIFTPFPKVAPMFSERHSRKLGMYLEGC